MMRRVHHWIPHLPLLAAALLLGVLSFTWAGRLPYPFDLEWMEGGMLAHAWRLSHGLPLYVPPNPDFVPYVYPPGYSALLAASGELVGLSPTLGRLWALAGSVAAGLAIAWAVLKRGGSWAVASAACVAFLGTYPQTGAFFDLARPDGMAIGLLAWAVVLTLEARRGAPVASGLLLCAAYMVKHNSAAFGVPIALGLWMRGGWRPAAQFTLAAAGPALAWTGLMQWRTEGRFLLYLLEVPASHPVIWRRVFPGLIQELGTALPVATAATALWVMTREASQSARPVWLSTMVPAGLGAGLGWAASFAPAAEELHIYSFPTGPGGWGLGVLGVVTLLRLSELRRRPLGWGEVFAAGVLLTAALLTGLMRAHNGGFLNVNIPLYWCVSLGFGLSVSRWRRPAWGSAALCAQLLWSAGLIHPTALTPTRQDAEAGWAYVQRMRQVEGPVLTPFSAWMPVYAGKAPSLHYMGVWDLNYPSGPYQGELKTIRRALRDHYWSLAVDGTPSPFGFGLREHYRGTKSPLKERDTALNPRSGWVVRPGLVMEPR